ncbi:MAG: 6,7-dimethyl-8-ribityllumazine synthase [Candidatus Hydrogenedentota bacterium]|nr:MAG: 6,7-dimethyl-8-ribityllumazine synthase [Candidatus Hydrogenedentota bacterium]
MKGERARKKVALIVSRTNGPVTQRLRKGARAVLDQTSGVEVEECEVVGAFELVAAARWARDAGFDAAVAIGAVVRGETPHFDWICHAVTTGLVRICTEGFYVAFGVLTVDSLAQAMARAGGPLGNKGAEAAEAAREMLALQDRLKRGDEGGNDSA